MLKRNICCFDFETGGKKAKVAQPTQLAAIGLDGRSLKPMGTFCTDIWAETDDEKAVAAGLHPLEPEALAVTGATRERIAAAPPLKTVWPKFVQFVNKLNWSGKPFFKPVAAGHNIIGYDMHIIDRCCKEFGPYDKEYEQQALFSPVFKIDLMDNAYMWFEADADTKSVNMATLREKFGISDENAHDALGDVLDTADIIRRLMMTHREVYRKLKW
jgi:DNA polymerase III epsilon subunit-like protein